MPVAEDVPDNAPEDAPIEPNIYLDRLSPYEYSPSDPAALYARPLTALEVHVANMVADGYDDRDIAGKRRVRIAYVRWLVWSVVTKLGLRSRRHLVEMWACPLFHEGLIVLNLVPFRARKFLPYPSSHQRK